MVTVEQMTRITNDSNGNPRYIIWYGSITDTYDEAARIAKPIGGKKFRGKAFGGGIVFQSYNIHETVKYINEVINNS